MKAVVVERYGTPDALELRDVSEPVPKPGEVVVRVLAASVNDWDWGLIRGKPFVVRLLHGLFKPRVQIPGCDIAGRVEAVGEGVDEFKPGDAVYGDLSASGFGAFAEYACAPESGLARMAAGMTFEQAAAIPQAGMLAVQGLIDVGGVRTGQKVLLNGAGGGVGTFALQLAKLHDAEVTVVDKTEKLEMLRGMGADRLIDYVTTDFTKMGGRFDLVLDVKTNRSPLAYARALRRGGIYVTVGGDMPRVLQLMVLGPLLSRLSARKMRIVGLKTNKDLGYMNQLFEAGQLRPVIDRVYPLAELPAALRFFGTGDHKGKIVITLN
jgi:NADPH:quinone reductase-like Zn-dependent oxidoreductase